MNKKIDVVIHEWTSLAYQLTKRYFVTMVHSVVTGCVENPFKWSQITNNLSMYPELVEQIKLRMGGKLTGWYEKSHRQKYDLNENRTTSRTSELNKY